MLTRKKEMVKSYFRWKDRTPPVFGTSVVSVDERNSEARDEEDNDEDSTDMGFPIAEI